MRAVFEGNLDPARLLDAIAIETGRPVDPESTLIVFDEIQECPPALTSLKMFHERRPDLAIIAAGSLLGVAMHSGQSFPVGKVEHLDLGPMSFPEFLTGTGQDQLAKLLQDRDFDLIGAFRERFTDALRRYFFVGGMPEAVQTYADTGDYRQTRAVHDRLLYDYEHDFSKHAPGDTAERVRLVWNAIPAQLAKENRRFVYSALRRGARARSFEEAIQWLVDAGLLLRVDRVSKPGLPLTAYRDLGAFKLFMLDVGLLAAVSGLEPKTLLDGDRLFEEFRGSLTEQYVCQQLVASGLKPFYWSAENSSGEIDFLYQWEGSVVPVEVKAAENLRAKSLRAFSDKYGIAKSVRFSLADHREQDWLTNIPLYACGTVNPAA
jgi:predicted AAA+ superfamily ATPase